jgi:hypothetical protein
MKYSDLEIGQRFMYKGVEYIKIRLGERVNLETGFVGALNQLSEVLVGSKVGELEPGDQF